MAGTLDDPETPAELGSARRLTTRRAVADALLAAGSGRVLTGAVAGLATARLALALSGRPFVGADLAVAAVVVALVGPVEWVIHKLVLHAPVDSRRLGVAGIGLGHRAHHAAPDDLRWITLNGPEAAGAVVGFGLVAGVVSLGVTVVLSASLLATAATGWLVAAIALTHYEYVHLLVHSGYRPRSRFYARLDRHHRLHHHRNEEYWLGVTSRLGDRLFGTLPRAKGDVPRSATTRTLSR